MFGMWFILNKFLNIINIKKNINIKKIFFY